MFDIGMVCSDSAQSRTWSNSLTSKRGSPQHIVTDRALSGLHGQRPWV